MIPVNSTPTVKHAGNLRKVLLLWNAQGISNYKKKQSPLPSPVLENSHPLENSFSAVRSQCFHPEGSLDFKFENKSILRTESDNVTFNMAPLPSLISTLKGPSINFHVLGFSKGFWGVENYNLTARKLKIIFQILHRKFLFFAAPCASKEHFTNYFRQMAICFRPRANKRYFSNSSRPVRE